MISSVIGFGYHDDAKTTASFDFEFDDELVTVGSKLDSSLDLDVYVVNPAYNFYRTERARFGLGLGVHIADIDLKISSQATVGGIVLPEQGGSLSFTAPVPNFYVVGAYAFTDSFLLRYAGGWMSLNYGDYDGELSLPIAISSPPAYSGFRRVLS